jgi:ADP-heptose:LPS heptosyltransferase
MDAERILIYRLGSIGDTVAALPCFHLIERRFPTAERLVLTNHPVSAKAAPLESVLIAGGFIHGSITYPVSTRSPAQVLQLAKKLRALKTRTLVYLAASRGLANAWRDVTYFRLCGFTDIIAAPLSRDLQRNRSAPDGSVERESARLARTLAALGEIDLADRSLWDLRITAAEHDCADVALQQFAGQPFVAFNTGGKAEAKDWGPTNWATLMELLGERMPGRGLAFVGGGEDSDRARALAERWPVGPCLDLCGQLTPRETAAVLERASLFIGHDSGPLHLADAVGVPAIGLFGNYNQPQKWHPSGASSHIIHRMSGVHDISPREVAAIALALPKVVV